MGRLGFYFDAEACSGCRTCQIACKDRNNLAIGQLYRRVRTFEVGEYPNASMYHYSGACNHCESPACVANCPTGAMYKADDGTVQHDDDSCIGCQSCVKSCPYEVPILLEDKSIAGKCDACKPFLDAGKNPVCVDACNMRVLKFGDLDELRAQYGSDLVSDLPILPDSSMTDPSTLIHPKKNSLESNFTEKII